MSVFKELDSPCLPRCLIVKFFLKICRKNNYRAIQVLIRISFYLLQTLKYMRTLFPVPSFMPADSLQGKPYYWNIIKTLSYYGQLKGIQSFLVERTRYLPVAFFVQFQCSLGSKQNKPDLLMYWRVLITRIQISSLRSGLMSLSLFSFISFYKT